MSFNEMENNSTSFCLDNNRYAAAPIIAISSGFSSVVGLILIPESDSPSDSPLFDVVLVEIAGSGLIFPGSF